MDRHILTPLLATLVIMLCVLTGFMVHNQRSLRGDTTQQKAPNCPEQSKAANQDVTKIEEIKKQRDELSRTFIQMSKEYQQYQCEKADPGTGSSGGWCTFEGHYTDPTMGQSLAEMVFKGDTVASFGDGVGEYKKIVDGTGKVQLYDSYDGAPFCEKHTNGLVKYLDLTVPIYGLRMYDWILCVEVGEHVPKAHEQTLLDNIARHAKKGIVLSWAVLNQPGRGHINNQPLEYIVEQLSIRGFELDEEHTARLKKGIESSQLQRNVHIYKRKAGHEPDMLMV